MRLHTKYRIHITIVMCSFSMYAFASHDGCRDSVEGDSLSLRGSLRTTHAEGYDISELTISTGTVVREFVSPDGTVFGVSWKGPIVPDLKQLLGSKFQQYSEAVRAQTLYPLKRLPLNIPLPGLVFQTGAHMGAFYGRAYIPDHIPVGVALEKLY